VNAPVRRHRWDVMLLVLATAGLWVVAIWFDNLHHGI
jgi:hypothetical protein